MLKNILKITFRNMFKNKLYTFINISGLAIGIAGCLLILSYVKYEVEFDTFHKDADKIFRVVTDVTMRDGTKMNTCLSSPGLVNYLQEDFPQIESATRIYPMSETRIEYENKRFYETGFLFVDSTFFKVFDFQVVLGDKDNLLKVPNSMIMCESVAQKYFGEDNPVGKVVTVDSDKEFTVVGVIKDLPRNSHMRFEVLAFYPTFRSFNLQNWGALSLYTYVKLNNEKSQEIVDAGFDKFVVDRMGSPFDTIFKIHLEPMLSIHLYSEREHDFSIRTDSNQIYILSIIALLIVIIAGINFMNLSTARSSTRSLEIGVRKVLGAARKELVFQHLGESIMLTFIASLISLILYIILLPELNELASTSITIEPVTLFFAILIFTIVIGVLAGSYPALFLSAFKPVNILKRKSDKSNSGAFARKGLVLFQFAIAIGLLICTGVVYQQMEFLQNGKLGFSKDEVLVIPIRDDIVQENTKVLKNAFLQQASVNSVSVTSGLPGYPVFQRSYNIPDSAGQAFLMYTIYADEDYVNTLKLNIKNGRNFSNEYATDNEVGLIINEAVVDKFSWKDPIGKEFTWIVDAAMNDTTKVIGKVIGVVENYYYQSKMNKIEPLVIRCDDSQRHLIALNVNTANVFNTVKEIEKTWNETVPGNQFVSNFLNETYDNLYQTEQRLGKLFVVFSLLAVIISCLGLLGLSFFMVERKTKEIGIRKVLGASALNIISGLSKEFSVWVALANVIAWPTAYFIMNNWLLRFEYRIEITFLPFILSSLGAFIIAFAVVGSLSAKTAGINPVDSLRSE